MATQTSPLSPHAGPPAKDGPWALEVALFEPRPELARVLLDGLLRRSVAAHFTDLEALARCCRELQPAAVALPLSLTTAGPELEQAVLAFLRAFGRRAAVVVYADTARLSVAEYSRPLAAGARRVLNEAAPTFVEDLCALLGQLVEDHRAQLEEEHRLSAVMARHGLVGNSPALREVFRRALRAAHFSDL
ncbi:MAG TPA: hypothetical protein VFA26_22240, partial [Gemmataceae bacterium]|nr:hypothetical protein [Gemmataceae bacterium]